MIMPDRYYYSVDFDRKSLETLETALKTVPAYAKWRSLDPGPNTDTDARYKALPGLTKQMIRENFPNGLVPGYRSVEAGLLSEEIEYTFTSGTTGDRVINVWDQNWWNQAEAASWKLNAHTAKLKYPQKEAKLASSLNVGICCEEDLPMESRIVGNKLYLNEKISVIQWQPRHFRRMARELEEFQPAVLEANPSLLARLAFWAIDEGVEIYSPKVIVFTYEFISRIHADAVSKIFKAPIISSYGTTETGFVLEECEHGLLHQNTEFCRIDFEPLKEEYGGPELGRILVTTFDNPWNSVIKFDTGDLVRLYHRGSCHCGRGEGLIAKAVEGRITNSTFTTSGELVTTNALDTALSEVEGIRDYHLEQHGKTGYELKLMLGGNSDKATENARKALTALYGRNGVFRISAVANILPGEAGKFRRTQCNFDFDWETLFV